MLRPGITISHARNQPATLSAVRSDVCGFIGIVPPSRWPRGSRRGDFIEMSATDWPGFVGRKASGFVDPVTKGAVQKFFENGGESCFVFAMCITGAEDLTDSEEFRQVFAGLRDRLRGEEDVGLLVMPSLAYLPARTGTKVEVLAEAAIEQLLEHCREMNNRFLIIDAPQEFEEESLARWVAAFRERRPELASFGALYFPWLMNGDEFFPPSGSVAGAYARVELEHAPMGVRWPPANIELRGCTHPALSVRWRSTDRLAAAGVNPLLTQPGRGVVIWGARTLSDDPKWRYINSRRIVSYVTEQLRRDSEWVVFEHQRPALWKIVSRMVRTRLDSFGRAGLLTGEEPGLDYLVQCDAELNPPEVRDAGQLHVRVLMRPISTAEFIEVELRLGA